MKYVLKGGDQEFDRFKEDVNKNITNLSENVSFFVNSLYNILFLVKFTKLL